MGVGTKSCGEGRTNDKFWNLLRRSWRFPKTREDLSCVWGVFRGFASCWSASSMLVKTCGETQRGPPAAAVAAAAAATAVAVFGRKCNV